MKKFIIAGLIVAAGFSTFTVTSCNKYEDGPKISLLTKKARLCGDWALEAYLVNDVDQTSAYQSVVGTNFEWDIEKDGTYKMSGNFTDNGTWELGEDKDDVRFLSSAANSTEVSYRILRLKSKELWLRYTAPNGDKEVMKLKAK